MLGAAVDGCLVLGAAVVGCPVLGADVIPDTTEEGRHISPFPPTRHEHTADPEVALISHELGLAVSGPKQSALTLHDPHAPAETAVVGSPEDAVTVPLCRLQRW